MKKMGLINRFRHFLRWLINPRSIFFVLTVMYLTSNSASLGKELKRMRRLRENVPYVFIGLKFSGLDDILQNVTRMGYYSDKDMDKRINALEFAQAEYTLVPVILDFNNTDHEYILFNCTNESTALKKIAEIGAVPVRKNQFGVILAKNPRFVN